MAERELNLRRLTVQHPIPLLASGAPPALGVSQLGFVRWATSWVNGLDWHLVLVKPELKRLLPGFRRGDAHAGRCGLESHHAGEVAPELDYIARNAFGCWFLWGHVYNLTTWEAKSQ